SFLGALTGIARRARELEQRVTGDSKDPPVVHRDRAERSVKVDRRLVPVQHRPLEATAAALDRNSRQLAQHRPPVTVVPMRRSDEEIFQVDSGTTQKGREVVEVEREADGSSVLLSDQCLGSRVRAKQMALKLGLLEGDLVREPFVLGEISNQL